MSTEHPSTRLVHTGRPDRTPDAPLSEPVTLSSTYVAGGPTGYGRFGNPTWSAFEEVVGDLEGGRAVAFASGMAAVAAVLELVPAGGRVLLPRQVYNGVAALVDRATGRWQVERVDLTDTEAVVAALPGTRLLWLESPSNPAMQVADLPALCAAGQQAGAIVAVDNTFATPLLQQPLRLGADIVVHSATKFLAGHSDVQLGVAVTTDDPTYDAVAGQRTERGAIPGPMETWLALRGIRTLDLRLERAQRSAGILAERLSEHPRISRVRYPGLPSDPGHRRATEQLEGYGAMLAAEVHGGAEAAAEVCERVRLWVHATSLGGLESMLERRRRWPSESPEIPENLLRLSVGIEHVDDLWNDLVQALD